MEHDDGDPNLMTESSSKVSTLESLSQEELVSKCKHLIVISKKAKEAKDEALSKLKQKSTENATVVLALEDERNRAEREAETLREFVNNLSESKEALVAKTESLQRQSTIINSDLQQLKEVESSLLETNHALNFDNEKLKKMVTTQQRVVEQLKDERAKRKETEDYLWIQEKSALLSKVESMEAALSQLDLVKENCRQLAHEREELQTSEKILKSKVDGVTQEKIAQSIVLQQMKDDLKAINIINDELKKTNKTMEKQSQSLQNIVETVKTERNNVSQELTKFKKELNEIRLNYETQKKENLKLKNDITESLKGKETERLREDLEGEDIPEVELMNVQTELKEKTTELELELCKTDLNEARRKLLELENKLNDTIKELEICKRDLAKFNETTTNVESKLEWDDRGFNDYESRLNEAKQKLQENEKNQEKYSKTIMELNKSIDIKEQITKQLEGTIETMDKMKDENELYQVEIQCVKDELKNIKNSFTEALKESESVKLLLDERTKECESYKDKYEKNEKAYSNISHENTEATGKIIQFETMMKEAAERFDNLSTEKYNVVSDFEQKMSKSEDEIATKTSAYNNMERNFLKLIESSFKFFFINDSDYNFDQFQKEPLDKLLTKLDESDPKDILSQLKNVSECLFEFVENLHTAISSESTIDNVDLIETHLCNSFSLQNNLATILCKMFSLDVPQDLQNYFESLLDKGPVLCNRIKNLVNHAIQLEKVSSDAKEEILALMKTVEELSIDNQKLKEGGDEQYKELIDDLACERDEAEKSLFEMKSECEKHLNDIKTCKLNEAELTKKVAETEADSNITQKLKKQVFKYDSSIEVYKTTEDDLKKQIHEYKSELEINKTLVNDLKKKVAQNELEMEEFRTGEGELTKQVSDYEKMYKTLEEDLKKQIFEYEMYKTMEQDLNKKITNYESDKQDCSTKETKLKKRLKEHESTIAMYQRMENELAEQVCEHENEKEVLKTTENTLKKRVNESENMQDLYKKKFIELKNQLEEQESQIEVLKTNEMALKEKQSTYDSEAETLEKTKADLNCKISELESELEKYRVTEMELKSEISELNSKLEKYSTTEMDQKSKITEMEGELEQYRVTEMDLKSKISELEINFEKDSTTEIDLNSKILEFETTNKTLAENLQIAQDIEIKKSTFITEFAKKLFNIKEDFRVKLNDVKNMHIKYSEDNSAHLEQLKVSINNLMEESANNVKLLKESENRNLNLQKELKEMQEKKENLHSHSEQSNIEIDRLKLELKNLNNEFEKDKKDLQNIIEKLNISNADLNNSNLELKKGTEHLTVTNEELHNSKEDLTNINNLLRNGNEELVKLNEELNISKEILENSNKELKNLNEELKNSYKELKSSNEELKNSNNELKNSNEELNNFIEELKNSDKELENSISTNSSEEKESLNKNISELLAANKDLSQELELSKKFLEGMSANIVKLNSENGELESSLEHNRVECNQAETDLEKSTVEMRSKDDKIENLKENQEITQMEFEELKTQLEISIGAEEKAKIEAQTYSSRCQEMLEELNQINQALRERGERISRHDGAIKEKTIAFEKREKELRHIINNLESELKNVKEEIKHLKSSSNSNTQVLKDRICELESSKLSNNSIKNNEISKTSVVPVVNVVLNQSLQTQSTETNRDSSGIGLHLQVNANPTIAHGNQSFNDTQSEVLSTSTIGRAEDGQRLRDLEGTFEERFMKLKTVAIKLKKKLAEQSLELKASEDARKKLLAEGGKSKETVASRNIQALQGEIDRVQDCLDAEKKSSKENSKQLLTSAQEISNLKNQIANTQEEISHLYNEIKLHQEKENASEIEITTLQSSYNDLEKKLNMELELKCKFEKEIERWKAMESEIEEAKQTSIHRSLIDLELKDYERTISELTDQVNDKSRALEELNIYLVNEKELTEGLRDQMKLTEAKAALEAERANKLKQQTIDMKEELEQLREKEDIITKEKQNDRNQIEKLMQDVERYKVTLAQTSASTSNIEATLKTQKEKATSKLETTEEELKTIKSQKQTLEQEIKEIKDEFNSYKLRAQSVLKQKSNQKSGQDLNQVLAEREQLTVDLEKTEMRLHQMQSDLVASKAEIGYLTLEKDRLTQEVDSLRRERDNIIKEAFETSAKKDTQLETKCSELKQIIASISQQNEETSNMFTQQIQIQKHTHEKEVEDLKHSIVLLELRLDDECQKNLVVGSPGGCESTCGHEKGSSGDNTKEEHHKKVEDVRPHWDIANMIREQGEGSEWVEPPPHRLSRYSPPPFDQLLAGSMPTSQQLQFTDDASSVISNATETSVKDMMRMETKLNLMESRVTHLSGLLSESESENARLVQLTAMLKEEIRRTQRNESREGHLDKGEYLKNVVFKFLILKSGDERARLVPVLATILQLSKEEAKELMQISVGDMGTADGSQGWGSYLHLWSGR